MIEASNQSILFNNDRKYEIAVWMRQKIPLFTVAWPEAKPSTLCNRYFRLLHLVSCLFFIGIGKILNAFDPGGNSPNTQDCW